MSVIFHCPVSCIYHCVLYLEGSHEYFSEMAGVAETSGGRREHPGSSLARSLLGFRSPLFG